MSASKLDADSICGRGVFATVRLELKHDGTKRAVKVYEHRVGAVPVEDCDCPQPEFTDCSKPPQKRDPNMIHDPVVFENRVNEPVDVFYWNGTCEELVSWDEIGGVQPFNRKPLLSTQGHSFRLRSAATRRFLMAHTLNDLVIRGCEEDENAQRSRRMSLDGLESLRAQARFFETEADSLRQQLATELSRLALAINAHGANATTAASGSGSYYSVTAGGAAAPMAHATLLSPLLGK